MDAVAGKLAFRQYLKEQGIKKSEKEFEMQEIYNRFFFFRKQEIKYQNSLYHGQGEKATIFANGDEEKKEESKRAPRLAQSMNHTTYDKFSRSNKKGHLQAIDTQSSMKPLRSIDSQASLDLDSVREIMVNCTGQIGKTGKVTKTKKDLAKVEQQK